MAAIATWSFGAQAVTVASSILKEGGECVEAVEKGINDVEDDPSTGKYLVGRGCYPNAVGVVQLDAAIMRGRDCRVGSVAAIEGYPRPVSVARHILENTKQSLIVGGGARLYAEENGFHLEENDGLMTEETRKEFELWKRNKHASPPPKGHDTLSLLCLDRKGSFCAGVSTSGPAYKLPGRVGDSPLPGCGYYANDRGGAAAATGDGDLIMQFCPSFHVVQLMETGVGPEEACRQVVLRMKQFTPSGFEVGIVALDGKGSFAAAGTVSEWTDFKTQITYKGFPYAVWKEGMPSPSVLVAQPV